MDVITDTNPQTCAAHTLEQKIRALRDTPILLMLSGGSSLGMIKFLSSEQFGSAITMTMLDERYDTDASNFAELVRTDFYKALLLQKVRCVDPRVRSGESLQAAAARFEKQIMAWRQEHVDGAIVVTQGIGADGHTAGVFPFPNDPETFTKQFEGNHLVVGYEVPVGTDVYQKRITATLTFLRSHVDVSIVYAVGEEKRGALQKVLAGTGKFNVTPARIVRDMRDVTIITDLIVSQEYTYQHGKF